MVVKLGGKGIQKSDIPKREDLYREIIPLYGLCVSSLLTYILQPSIFIVLSPPYLKGGIENFKNDNKGGIRNFLGKGRE